MIAKEDILAAFNFRHACKTFDPAKKISDADFGFILETGRLSPSSFGFEPWRFVVIQNPALREALKATVWGGQGQLPTASHVVAILCRKGGMRYDAAHIRHMMVDVQQLPEDKVAMKLDRYRKFQESDFRLLDSPRALFDWACKQAYIALGNMMTSAALIGIDSCPIEGYDVAATEALLAKEGVLDTAEFGLAVMVAFGYRINPQSVKTRQSVEEVVAWVR
ncbi:MAG: NAD(P)H-dependent oxidoreductase [Sulfuricellaceae bacterium]|jgi:nitroreductase